MWSPYLSIAACSVLSLAFTTKASVDNVPSSTETKVLVPLKLEYSTHVDGKLTWICNNSPTNPCTVAGGVATAIALPGTKPAAATATVGDCTATCWDYVPSQPLDHCDISCANGFITRVPPPTAKMTTMTFTVSNKNRLTITDHGCTVVAWNLQPGVGADVECPKMKYDIGSQGMTFHDDFDCTWNCHNLRPGIECEVSCPTATFSDYVKEMESTAHIIPNMIQSEGLSHDVPLRRQIIPGHHILEERKHHKQGKEKSTLRPLFWSFNPNARYDHNMDFDVPTAILSDTMPAPPEVTQAMQSAYSKLSATQTNVVTPRPAATVTTVAATATFSSVSVKTTTTTSSNRPATTTVSATTSTSTTATSTATVSYTVVSSASDDRHAAIAWWIGVGIITLQVLTVIVCLLMLEWI